MKACAPVRRLQRSPAHQHRLWPHAPYTLGDQSLARIAILANELQAPVHIHVHETAQEVADSLAQHGQRPLARLYELGLLSPQTQCVHMTQINDDDLRLLQETGAKVIHCQSPT